MLEAAAVAVAGDEKRNRRMRRNRKNCYGVVEVLKKVDEYKQTEVNSNHRWYLRYTRNHHLNRMGCGKMPLG